MENQDKKVLDLAMEAGRILLDAWGRNFPRGRNHETDCQSIWN